MQRTRSLTSRLSTFVLAAAAVATAPSLAHAKAFDGFNDHFNLGLSTVSGEVCEASRSFDDPLIAKGARAWSVTCRGVSGRRGVIYLFPAGRAARLRTAWRSGLATRADCPQSAASSAVTRVACKTKPAGLDYVVLTSAGRGAVVVAEGRAAIADRLALGQAFVAGKAAEPKAVAEQTAAVTQITGSHGRSALDEADRSPEAQRVDAYRSGQDWRFEDAETVFGELANPAANASTSRISREEALYNLALNVSNKGRFGEASGYFEQADALAATTGSNAFSDLALNYKAAHARNQGDYQGAIKLAQAGIAARRDLTLEAVKRDPSGAIEITDSGGNDGLGRLTPRERRTLRDVQALEIEGTSQEALGQVGPARETLAEAERLTDEPLAARGSGGGVRRLGEATPWLNTQVRADILRLDRGTDREPNSAKQFRIAVNAFGQRYPGSLPLAGRLVELGRAEVSLARTDKAEEDRALADYESAFDIFRRQRGSIEASADLVRPYFDVLLARLAASPGDGRSVERFFTAAQTLVSQSSAEAANRQAAQSRLGDERTASLARRLDEVGRDRDAVLAEVRDLEQKGLYSGAAKTRLDLEAKSLAETSAKLEGELEQVDPRFASQLRTVVTLDELKKALSPGEVYVKVFLLAGRGYGVLISPTEAKPYAVDLSREKALAMVTKLRDPIDHPTILSATARSPRRYDVALAHQTFETLFGPVRSEVLSARHIIYEPDANLIGAPLPALVVDEASVATMKANVELARSTSRPLTYAGVAWLGARASTSTALSAPAFVIARAAPSSRAASPFYGFGDPVISQDQRAFFDVKSTTPVAVAEGDFCARVRTSLFHLQPLPQTATEIKDVAASLGQGSTSYALGTDFNDTDILRRGAATGDLSHYKVIYFATHGILPQPNGCMQSALLTSLGDGDSDALLDVKKIPKLHLDADMVVLSACDTGRSGDGRGGEALGGLVTTFVEAGARNVVVSNWEVDTNATVRLMKAMFGDKGATQADALAVAERELMASPDQYSHPYFWASFTVVGDGARPMPAV